MALGDIQQAVDGGARRVPGDSKALATRHDQYGDRVVYARLFRRYTNTELSLRDALEQHIHNDIFHLFWGLHLTLKVDVLRASNCSCVHPHSL